MIATPQLTFDTGSTLVLTELQLRGASQRRKSEFQCRQCIESTSTMDAHALLHQPVIYRKSLERIRWKWENEGI